MSVWDPKLENTIIKYVYWMLFIHENQDQRICNFVETR